MILLGALAGLARASKAGHRIAMSALAHASLRLTPRSRRGCTRASPATDRSDGRRVHAGLPLPMKLLGSMPPASRSAARATSSHRRRSARSSASSSASGRSRCGSPWASRRESTVAELGPGRGTLMADASRAWRGVPKFLDSVSVALIETSPVMVEAQRKTLQGCGRTASLVCGARRGAGRPADRDRQRVHRCAAHPAIRPPRARPGASG